MKVIGEMRETASLGRSLHPAMDSYADHLRQRYFRARQAVAEAEVRADNHRSDLSARRAVLRAKSALADVIAAGNLVGINVRAIR